MKRRRKKLREQLPRKLLEPLHWKLKDPAIPANNDAKKGRKRRREVISRARQRVQWSYDRQEWFAEFVTKPELDVEQGHAAAEETWKHWCFDLECKKIDEFREPVTKAEAYAAWANTQYSWKSCARWWGQHHKSAAAPRKMDEESRTRMAWSQLAPLLMLMPSLLFLASLWKDKRMMATVPRT